MALHTMPLVAGEYGETTIQVYDSLGTVAMGLNTIPYVANAANSINKNVDDALPFGAFGDLTTSSRCIAAERTLKAHPNNQIISGNSLSSSVALYLQKHHPN